MRGRECGEVGGMSDLKNKDGGPAYPINMDEFGIQPGMSLRDFFAAAALQGLLSNSNNVMLMALGRDAEQHNELRTSETYSREAYEVSDAMLKERNKP